MDNNMSAIVSAMMLAIGFLHGAIVATAIHTFRTNYVLNRAVDEKFEADKRIDDLESELEDEKQEKEDLLAHLRSIVGYYTQLPPPSGPMTRSEHCCDSDDEENFECPTSPDLNPDNKE